MRNNIWYYISISFTFQYLLCGIFLVLLSYLRKVKDKYIIEIKAVKPFVWLMLFGALYEIIFTIILFVNNAYWFTLYGFFEFLALNYMFYHLLNRYKILYVVFNIVFIVFFIGSLSFWNIQNHSSIEGYHAAFETVFIMTWAVLWFKDLFKGDEMISLWKKPAFYFVIGIVLYLCGGVVPSLVTPYLFKATGLWTKYWLVFLVLGTFMRIMIIIGVLKATVKKP